MKLVPRLPTYECTPRYEKFLINFVCKKCIIDYLALVKLGNLHVSQFLKKKRSISMTHIVKVDHRRSP